MRTHSKWLPTSIYKIHTLIFNAKKSKILVLYLRFPVSFAVTAFKNKTQECFYNSFASNLIHEKYADNSNPQMNPQFVSIYVQ